MQLEGSFRHELKYRISEADYMAIRSRAVHIMKRDPHVGESGQYLIRSVYFDNYNDKALREKIDGVQKREKFRIRWYNDDLSFIKLEKKFKYNSLCKKDSAVLTENEFRALLSGDKSWMMNRAEPCVRELYLKMNLQQLKPRVLVSYIREPYIFKAGNVRLTFDSKIRSSLFGGNFIENMHDIEVTEPSGGMILELKYDEFLPDIIACLVQSESLRLQAFSKYGQSRIFG